MSDYIKRENAMRVLADEYDECEFKKYAEDLFKDIPSEDVVPVRHGHWVLPNIEKTDRPLPECSCCGWYVSEIGVLDFTYCPNCGARMDGGNDE